MSFIWQIHCICRTTISMSTEYIYYLHPKDVECTVCIGVCSQGGGIHLHPIILPLVPCPFQGTPSQSHNTSSDPMSFLGVTPSPSNSTSTGPLSFLGDNPSPFHNIFTVPCPFCRGTSVAGGCTSNPGGTPLART